MTFKVGATRLDLGQVKGKQMAIEWLEMNFFDSVEELNEALWQNDYKSVCRWATIADTFGEML